jgi:hypothetical protein
MSRCSVMHVVGFLGGFVAGVAGSVGLLDKLIALAVIRVMRPRNSWLSSSRGSQRVWQPELVRLQLSGATAMATSEIQTPTHATSRALGRVVVVATYAALLGAGAEAAPAPIGEIAVAVWAAALAVAILAAIRIVRRCHDPARA